jgi:hypothetical protein
MLPLLIVMFACNDQNTRVPVATCSFEIYLSSYDADLAVGTTKSYPCQQLYCGKGYLGTIVYRYGQEDFVAFDLACPNDYYYGVPIHYDEANACYKCDQCGTRFNLLSGFAEGGSTYKYSLRQYTVTKVNDILYQVSN